MKDIRLNAANHIFTIQKKEKSVLPESIFNPNVDYIEYDGRYYAGFLFVPSV